MALHLVIEDTLYTFDMLQEYAIYVPSKEYCHYARCKETGQYAWIDTHNGENHVQFEGSSTRVPAIAVYDSIMIERLRDRCSYNIHQTS